MAQLDVLKTRSFGETSRRDAWWVQPLAVFLGLSAFVVYSTWAAFQGEHYHFGPYLSPFYSPELFGDPRTPGSAASPPGGRPGCPSRRRSSSSGRRAASASPATTTAAPTTRRSGPTRRPARWASRARATSASARFPLILQNVHRYFLYLALALPRLPRPRRVEGAVVHRPGDRRDDASASASARWCWRSTSSCSAATRSAATRCATWSAACVDQPRRRAGPLHGLPLRQLPQPAAHAAGPG